MSLLASNEFVLYLNYEALTCLSNQHKLCLYAKWVDFLQTFQFVLKHKSSQLNKVTNALSRRYALLNAMRSMVVVLRLLKPFIKKDDSDFGNL